MKDCKVYREVQKARISLLQRVLIREMKSLPALSIPLHRRLPGPGHRIRRLHHLRMPRIEKETCTLNNTTKREIWSACVHDLNLKIPESARAAAVACGGSRLDDLRNDAKEGNEDEK